MLLSNKARIRRDLREVTAAGAGRRVILSAYVGRDALEYVQDPRGVQIYCSPNPVGTDPDGLESLLREGARIWFVERLHAKVYWSERAGCLIGSPNLSTNALGEAGLFETVYRADDVNIDSLMVQVAKHKYPVEVTPRVLEAFRRRCRRAHGQVLQPAVRRARETPTFEEWVGDRYRKPFTLLRWDHDTAPDLTGPEREAVREYNELHDTGLDDDYTDFLTVYGSVIKMPENEDVVCVRVDEDETVRATGAFWLRYELRTESHTGRAGRGRRTRIIQVRPRRESVPFIAGGKFMRDTLSAFFEGRPPGDSEGVVFATGSPNEKVLLRAAGA
jgi:hypothetical protein